MKRFAGLAVWLLGIWLAAGGAMGLEISPYTALGPYPSNGIASASLDFSMTAIGATMSATFTCTGKELVLAYNPGVDSASFCVASVTDEFGAKGDIAETVSGASVCAFWFGDRKGWDNGSGVAITSTTSGLQLAVLKLTQVFKPVSGATTASRYTISDVLGPYPTSTQIAASHLELQQNIAGYVANATIPLTGREVFIVHNTSATNPYTFQISGSARNRYNRWLTVPNGTAYSLGAGEWACWVLSAIEGFANTDGHCWWTGEDASLKLGIAKLGMR